LVNRLCVLNWLRLGLVILLQRWLLIGWLLIALNNDSGLNLRRLRRVRLALGNRLCIRLLLAFATAPPQEEGQQKNTTSNHHDVKDCFVIVVPAKRSYILNQLRKKKYIINHPNKTYKQSTSSSRRKCTKRSAARRAKRGSTIELQNRNLFDLFYLILFYFISSSVNK
jgi:hypothetical protein